LAVENNQSKGKDYEDYVEMVYRAIHEAESPNGSTKPVCIERNKIITSHDRTSAEIDIYWEFDLGGITYRVAVECKNLQKPVAIDKVRDFKDKITNLGLKGLMVSKSGFTSQARKKASAAGIDLIVIREQVASDWNGRLKFVNLTLTIQVPCEAVKIMPVLDDQGFSVIMANLNEIQMRDTEMQTLVFEDLASDFRHTLQELERQSFFEDKGFGKQTWQKSFADGWLHLGNQKFKIHSVEIDYIKSSPQNMNYQIDFGQNVLAFLEYKNDQNKKFFVTNDGKRQELPHT
jgi:Restriction endonuclease